MWRAFNVGAVLESVAFRGAVVAAGSGGLARSVSGAHLAARPEDLRRVAADDLIVTTSVTLLGTGEDGEGLVARLRRGAGRRRSPFASTSLIGFPPRCWQPPTVFRSR